MDVLRITGGARLSGRATVSGSKNAALPIMAASILSEGLVTLQGVPELGDVATLSQVLSRLGVAAARLPGGDIALETFDTTRTRADYELVRKMRASFCVLGPLLARRGRATVSLPGGCRLGPRPVDLHLRGLAALGADIALQHGYIVARARRLRGAKIDLCGQRGPSVTATANVLSAAVLAEGETEITSAAREPEVVDLGNFLNAMGARITGLGSSRLVIQGVRQLAGVAYQIIPDRVEAATLLCAASLIGDRVEVAGLNLQHLDAVLAVLAEMGATLEVKAGAVTVAAPERLRPVVVSALPYPGLPTDVQPQLMALSALADGASVFRDAVFPARFQHIAALNRLGARIQKRASTAEVAGAPALCGAEVRATDLRAAAALMLAGLAATGVTTLRGVQHLDRGYERLDQKLGCLGASIERVAVHHFRASVSETEISRPRTS